MGIAERREKERRQRIDLILDAAEKVFEAKGLYNATMDDIAEVAELGKSTLYLYFKSKELLYLSLDFRGSQIQLERFRKAVENHADGRTRVLAIGQAYLNYCLEYPLYFRAKTQSGRLDPEQIASFKDDPLVQEYQTTLGVIQGILITAIKAGIDDGTIRSDVDPLKTALVLWSQSNGVIELLLNRGDLLRQIHGIEPNDIVTEYMQLLERSLNP